MEIYLFNKDDPSGPARNNASFKVNTLKSYHINQPKFGIKYPTWLHGIRSYDLVNGLGIDYMHGVMIGVIKLKLKLWFSNEHKRESFSVHDQLTLFHSRLVDIKPTVEITRPPISYQKFSHGWNASGYTETFHGIPVLIGILPKEQLPYLSWLSHSIYKLLQ